MAGRQKPDLTDWSAQAAHYTDPEQPFPPGRPCQPGEGAAVLIAEAFGTRDAAAEYVRMGRPRIGRGGGQGESRSLRGRVSDEQYEAFERIMAATGESQSDLVRQAVDLLIAEAKSQDLIAA
jgi:hypothetical protein